VQHLAIHQLAQLQQLRPVACLQQQEQLQQLSSLSKLTHIDLVYVTAWDALTAASTWRHLSALRSVSISNSMEAESNLTQEFSTELLAHLAAASSLQCLDINGLNVLQPAAYVCDYVTNLHQLQSLQLTGVHPSTHAEALTLTKLTHLTVLRLDGAEGVDDVAAVALAARLTDLRSLSLIDCRLRSAAALPVIAMLTALKELALCYNHPLFELPAEELRLLAPLRQLRELTCYGFVDSFAMEQLWDEQNGRWREQQ
jgi:Leucine-rich repeat (LRR) protein